jgi:hypothetical protein
MGAPSSPTVSSSDKPGPRRTFFVRWGGMVGIARGSARPLPPISTTRPSHRSHHPEGHGFSRAINSRVEDTHRSALSALEGPERSRSRND